jgi:hypothetical protein
MSALAVGLAVSYVTFTARKESADRLFKASGLLRQTKSLLLIGLGFDRFYAFLIGAIGRPLVRAAATVQTGVLGKNLTLLVSALLVLIVLIVTGVL